MVIAMYSKCDAIVYPVDHVEALSYCKIINLDIKRKEVWVRFDEEHNLQNKEKVNIQSYDEIKGLLFYRGIVNDVSACKVVIKKLCLVDEKQRRYDVRVSICMPLVLKGLIIDNNFTRLKETVLLETINISAGGMLLKSDSNIEPEDACLVFDLPLETKYLYCQAQIVRKQIDNESYYYGCKLLNNENDKTELRKFVFKTQIKNRKVIVNFG